jgi:hypothetical protein
MSRTSLAIYAVGAVVMAVACTFVRSLGAPLAVTVLVAMALGALTGEVVWRVQHDRDGQS